VVTSDHAASVRDRLRLGVVPYLNVAPLVHGIDRDPRFEIVRATPRDLAEQEARGEVDLAIMPTAAYDDACSRIVPGLGIISRNAVRSVRLFQRVPIEKVRRVAVDSSSRASALLLRVLLRARLGEEPEYVVRPPALQSMLEETDAALLIGDAALDADGVLPSLDLGEEWRRLTGYPFVYAFWAGRSQAVTAADVERLHEATRSGVEAIPELARKHGSVTRANPDEREARARFNESYLREHVSYTLDDEALAGLREFYGRAHANGWLPRVPTLRFYGDR
jgi:chorismate dehydratase